jgi:hypothetical protein
MATCGTAGEKEGGTKIRCELSGMNERRTAHLIGLSLGLIFTCVLVLNAVANF